MEQHITGRRFAYLRVSSPTQNLDRQRDAVGDVDRMFEDHVPAASDFSRPALREMLRYVRNGDEVRVPSMDRLARSVIDLSEITEAIVNEGGQVYFVSEGITYSPDKTDPSATFQLQVLAAVAQLERSIIQEHQN